MFLLYLQICSITYLYIFVRYVTPYFELYLLPSSISRLLRISSVLPHIYSRVSWVTSIFFLLKHTLSSYYAICHSSSLLVFFVFNFWPDTEYKTLVSLTWEPNTCGCHHSWTHHRWIFPDVINLISDNSYFLTWIIH